MSELISGITPFAIPTELDALKTSLSTVGIQIATNIVTETQLISQFWSLCMETLDKAMDDICNQFENKIKQYVTNNEEPANAEFTPAERRATFKQNIANISWSDSDITLSPTEFYKKFFANCLRPDAFSPGAARPFKDWRDVYEHLNASSQCDAAEKQLPFNAITGWNICYICGLPITPENPGECEHLLPAFTALGCKGLIQSARANYVNQSEDFSVWFQYEYANAHICCNQIKQGIIWIDRQDINSPYTVMEDRVRETLRKIRSGIAKRRNDCGSIPGLREALAEGAQIEGRLRYIVDQYLNTMCEMINKEKDKYGTLHDLKIRINQINALRLNIPNIAAYILNAPVTPINDPNMIGIDNALVTLKKEFSPEKLMYIYTDALKAMMEPFPNEAVKGFIKQLNPDFVGSSRNRGNLLTTLNSLLSQVGQSTLQENASKHLTAADADTRSMYMNEVQLVENNKLIAISNKHLVLLSAGFKEFVFALIEKAQIPNFNDPSVIEYKEYKIAKDKAEYDKQLLIGMQGGGIQKRSIKMRNKIVGGNMTPEQKASYFTEIITAIEPFGVKNDFFIKFGIQVNSYVSQRDTFHSQPVRAYPGSNYLRKVGNEGYRINADGLYKFKYILDDRYNDTRFSDRGTDFDLVAPWHERLTSSILVPYQLRDGSFKYAKKSFAGGKRSNKIINKTKKRKLNNTKYTIKIQPSKKKNKLKIKKLNLRNKHSKQTKV